MNVQGGWPSCKWVGAGGQKLDSYKEALASLVEENNNLEDLFGN